MQSKSANTHPDAVIARIAAGQHGVISLDQLQDAGIRRQGLATRLGTGHLHRIHRGVFAVGHPGLSREGRWMAAVLACDPDAVLSQISAAELWGIVRSKRRPSKARSEDVAHVTVPSEGGRRRRRGIVVHRSRTLVPSQVTRRLGIQVTTPARTLADLRRILPAKRFAAALREAEFLGLPLDPQLGPDGTRSEMEALFLGLCRRHRLPRPAVNMRIGKFDVDFLWPERRLVVEVDGWDTHRTRSAFEEDRARDLKRKLLGYVVVRFTWRQLTEDSAAVASALRELLRK